MSDTVSKRPFSFIFNLGNKVKSQRAEFGKEGGWRTLATFLLVTNYVVFRDVGGHVVVMKEPVVVAPKFWSFSSHIFPQASQNITVKVRVDCSVRRNKYMVNSPLHVNKNDDHALCGTPNLPHLFFCSW
jgi:hypothetical protein